MYIVVVIVGFSILLIIEILRKWKMSNNESLSKKEIYHEYLKSKSWIKKRNKALKRAGYKCQVCGYNKNLQVHHNTYERIYHEHKQDLVVLCWKCHATFHKK
ncbi:MAG: hypothetical protein E7C49_01080 [Clostridium sp.]|nr:hypothetical protein [Clostridium sp.]